MTKLKPEAHLSYLDRAVLRVIADVYQRTRAPVRTIAVQARLGKGARNCRRYLTSMEQRGLVLRVGQRGGWLPVSQLETEWVAVEYARMREYAGQLEAQLQALLWLLGLPANHATLQRVTAAASEVDWELYVQPPLPGFGGLARPVYLN